jgi:hypothetical protein
MHRIYLFLTYLIILQLSLPSCGRKMEKSSEKDNLFLGFYLGMPQKDFFDHCTALNKQQLITQAPGGNTSVEQRIKENFSSEVSMRFFPTFIEERIFEMPVTYSYVAWAPWNKQYWADQLLDEVLKEFKLMYGEDFKLLNHPTQGKVYYRIDGKRRINLFVKDEQFVQAVFTDLKVEKRLKEEYSKKMSPDYN